jgi:alkylresorcinol/alkylpyrone synthase
VGKIENSFGKAIEVIGTAPQEQEASSVRIASVASALPEHRFRQEVITAAFKGYWKAKLPEPEKLDWLHARVGVDFRHLAFPLDRYPQFSTWGEANAAWLEAA